MVRETKYRAAKLTNSNFHTRQYLLPLVREEVNRLQADSQEKGVEKYYMIANANSKGINFEA